MSLSEPNPRPLLEISRLRVVFGGAPDAVVAVDDLSLELSAGASLGIVGESGSGKSTVLRAVVGLAPVSSGSIRLSGQALADLQPRERARRVQMVFQDPFGALHPRQTVDDQLAEPLRIHGLPAIQEAVTQAMDQVALPSTLRYRYPHQLSGGQRQRVCIARALMLSPSLLLLDEPTSALDVSVQAEVLNLLARLRRERGISFLFVSHDLAVVSMLCDRIAIMQNGQLVELVSSDALRAGQVREPYAARLLAAAR